MKVNQKYDFCELNTLRPRNRPPKQSPNIAGLALLHKKSSYSNLIVFLSTFTASRIEEL